jgi:hypothetical protein
MRRLALLTLFSLIVPASAGAAIIPFLQSGPTLITSGSFAGDFEFNYVAQLSGNERLDPGATNTSGDLPPGTFFTLYDIGGLVSFSATAPFWSPSFQPLGLTPSSIPTSFDSAGLPNVTFTYNGPVVHANGTTLMITGFQIISTLDAINPGNFSSQSTLDLSSGGGVTDQVSGPVTVPGVSVAEPATVALLGFAFVGMGWARRRTRH